MLEPVQQTDLNSSRSLDQWISGLLRLSGLLVLCGLVFSLPDSGAIGSSSLVQEKESAQEKKTEGGEAKKDIDLQKEQSSGTDPVQTKKQDGKNEKSGLGQEDDEKKVEEQDANQTEKKTNEDGDSTKLSPSEDVRSDNEGDGEDVIKPTVKIEPLDRFLLHGAPHSRFRITVTNPDDNTEIIGVPTGVLLGYGFSIEYGDKFQETALVEIDRGGEIALPPGGFVGSVIDLQMYADPLPVGHAQVRFEVPEWDEIITESFVLPDPRTQQISVFTDFGLITLEFLPNLGTGWVLAPNTVSHFMKLSMDGFYDGTVIHRIYKDFIIQCGDPTGTGRGGPPYTIDAELNNTPHRKGTVSMARHPQKLDSAGSQFFFVHSDNVPELDGLYTAFATIVDGMAVLDTIADLPVGMTPFGERSRPKEPVFIRKIEVSPKLAPPPHETEGAESEEGEGDQGVESSEEVKGSTEKSKEGGGG